MSKKVNLLWCMEFMIHPRDWSSRDIRSGNEESAFRIVQDGSLRTAKKFNHKVRDQYILQIRVFDNGTPPLYSDSYGKMTKYQFIFGKNKNMFSFQ